MGNTSTTSRAASARCRGAEAQEKGSQFQVDVNFTTDLDHSFVSAKNNQSFSAFGRSKSRASRKRCKRSVSTHDLSKTVWPVSQVESFFLPEFPVTSVFKGKNFVVLEEIASGSFGKVFRIQDDRSDEIFALKVLFKSQIIRENSVEQVKNEVLIQAACGHHPFIVNCLFYWQNRKQLFIVSEYVEGGELFALLKTYSALPIDLTKIYIAELALILDFLHNAGVIYRDLKPENILLDRDGHLQLTDFGLSKWLSYSAKTKTLCGTLRYMAPEVVSLQPYGHAADWWSLGIIACLMITGQFPTSAVARENDEASSSKKPGTLPEDVDLNRASKDLLVRILEVDPTKRMRSLRMLQTIAFFKGYDFEAVKSKSMRPFDLLENHFPAGPPPSTSTRFDDF